MPLAKTSSANLHVAPMAFTARDLLIRWWIAARLALSRRLPH